jgi:hypothetical protein
VQGKKIMGRRKNSKSDAPEQPGSSLESIADVIGSVHGLPRDLSRRKKYYLRKLKYGQKNRKPLT